MNGAGGVVGGVVIGVVGTLFVQATFREALGWWYDVVDTFREWVMSILGVCGVLFIIAVIAYVGAGWRP